MRILLLCLCLSLTSLACGGGGADTGAENATPDSYTVRGVVKSLSGDEVSVQHEAIPGFKGRDGKAADMMSMTMAFGIGEGVDRTALAAGNKVSMTFEVRWSARPALRITKVEPLPADTALTLE